MTGFDKDWLALREPADIAARAPALIDMFSRHLTDRKASTILDIGCGTGSTWRTLESRAPHDTRWLLLDHDPLLLEEAERRIGVNNKVTYKQIDLNDLAKMPLQEMTLVTASALFDLVSEDFCAAFVDRLSAQNCGLYAALNYDGTINWSHPHPLDGDMVGTFNRHQQTDKGFGKALGPHAATSLERLLSARDYQVHTMKSPWRMDTAAADLQEAFITGFREPLMAMSEKPEAEIEHWLSYRLCAIMAPDSLCEVGHTDLIAFPAR